MHKTGRVKMGTLTKNGLKKKIFLATGLYTLMPSLE